LACDRRLGIVAIWREPETPEQMSIATSLAVRCGGVGQTWPREEAPLGLTRGRPRTR